MNQCLCWRSSDPKCPTLGYFTNTNSWMVHLNMDEYVGKMVNTVRFNFFVAWFDLVLGF